MSLSIVPFTVQLPSGYSLSAAGSGAQATSRPAPPPPGRRHQGATTAAKSSDPVDIVSISNASVAGIVHRGHRRHLPNERPVQGQCAVRTAIVGYRVALGAVPDGVLGGQLQLNGDPVTDGRTSFTADEFAHLTYTTGDGRLAAEPRGGRPDRHAPGGRHTDPRDRQPGGADHRECHRQPLDQRDERPHRDECPGRSRSQGLTPTIADIVQGAGIFNGFVGSTRPTLQTDGNFTAVTGDIYR